MIERILYDAVSVKYILCRVLLYREVYCFGSEITEIFIDSIQLDGDREY